MKCIVLNACNRKRFKIDKSPAQAVIKNIKINQRKEEERNNEIKNRTNKVQKEEIAEKFYQYQLIHICITIIRHLDMWTVGVWWY